MTTLDNAVSSQTLAQRLAQGKIPAPEALRCAMILAESLRKMHDAGQVHGAVSPNTVAISRTGLELLPAVGGAGSITRYTAPEIVQGRPADARSDIFSFGAVFYEMLTGRPAFNGEGVALADALVSAPPAPSGSPAVDRLVSSCVAKEPGARQAMRKILLEIKLLAVAVQRAESAAPVRREVVDPIPAVRAEIQQVETRLTIRLARCESNLEAVNGHISQIGSAVQEGIAALARLEQSLQERISQLERTGNDRMARIEQALGNGADRVDRLEHTLDAVRQDTAALRETVSEDLAMFDKTLKSQTVSLDSARTAMTQTDDLVERVVEALESLQSVVLEHSDDRAVAAN